MKTLLLLALLADSVYVCPASSPESALPLPLPQGCPAPTYGILYPEEHPQDVASLIQASDEQKQKISTLTSIVEELQNQWGPTTWLLIGITSGVILTYGGQKLKTYLD
jgi:hypothetical protein